MSGFKCLYCSMVMSLNELTKAVRTPTFYAPANHYSLKEELGESCLELTFYKCPNCHEYSILAKGTGSAVADIGTINIRPLSFAMQFPDYVPLPIRQDYTEACAIVSLSPKASATLSRRCLQGMIRDFWGISKPRLVDEINSLKDKIPAQQWRVIDGLRRIGNIGAHMENDINTIVDIDPDEANKLIKLIELLIEQWYINRHNQEQLYSDIINIDETKHKQRKKNE